MRNKRQQTLIEIARWLYRMKGLDRLQLETFINNTLYILDVIYYSIRAFKKNEKIPEDIRREALSLPHPKKDRLRFSEIQRITKFSTRTVSKHLRWLTKIKLVTKLSSGYYTLSKDIYTKDYSEFLDFKREIKNHIEKLVGSGFKK